MSVLATRRRCTTAQMPDPRYCRLGVEGIHQAGPKLRSPDSGNRVCPSVYKSKYAIGPGTIPVKPLVGLDHLPFGHPGQQVRYQARRLVAALESVARRFRKQGPVPLLVNYLDVDIEELPQCFPLALTDARHPGMTDNVVMGDLLQQINLETDIRIYCDAPFFGRITDADGFACDELGDERRCGRIHKRPLPPSGRRRACREVS